MSDVVGFDWPSAFRSNQVLYRFKSVRPDGYGIYLNDDGMEVFYTNSNAHALAEKSGHRHLIPPESQHGEVYICGGGAPIELLKIADGLDKAERLGMAEDVPEGVRYVLLSDTLCRKLSESIRDVFKGGVNV